MYSFKQKTNPLRTAGLVIGFCSMIVVFIAVMNYCAMLAWNFVMPSLFGLPEITFWKMFVLVFLVNVLLTGVRSAKRS